ncbi:hypothetical protein DXG03_001881, partial [Asterophora parasitica]
NHARASRLRGLLNHIAILQKDTEIDYEKLEKFDAQARDIEKSLGDVGLKSLDSVLKTILVRPQVPATTRFKNVLATSTEFFGLFGGGEQRNKLISGIHDAQIARLVTAAVRQSIRQKVEETRLLQLYLSALTNRESESAVQHEGQEYINLASLEADLQLKDRQSGAPSNYNEDDLTSDEVISAAKQQLQG